MDEFVEIFVYSFLIFCGSLFGGLLPLIFNIDDKLLNQMSVLSCGLLIGTGLTIVIPEGVESLLQVKEDFTNLNQSLGGTIIAGFLFMMIIDWFNGSHGHSHGYKSLSSPKEQQTQHNLKSTKSITLGLTIHAAADGIALGAAKSSINLSTTSILLIFLAVLSHKVPASVSLTTLLKIRCLPLQEIHRALFIFSFAAPLGMLMTYGFLELFKSDESIKEGEYLGSLSLLFAGGTFIFVSCVHILNDIDTNSMTKGQLFIFCLGALLPLFLSLLFPEP